MLSNPMSKIEKFSVDLPPELNEIVQEALATGRFSSSGEVVMQALRDWKSYEKAKAEALEHMRALIQEGIDSGPGREIDFDELKAELHAEFERRNDAKRRVA
jgi:antitoxin ParD1/3/4